MCVIQSTHPEKSTPQKYQLIQQQQKYKLKVQNVPLKGYTNIYYMQQNSGVPSSQQSVPVKCKMHLYIRIKNCFVKFQQVSVFLDPPLQMLFDGFRSPPKTL
eukprot:EC095884.1.p4 GENE.EC095884.1~~EC095884.1.p4  ORF type:complete len:102 (-),score=7.67 EC095884.1:150-455(-)